MRIDQEKLLVDDILAGNLRAFEKLIEAYKKLVGHIVFRMILNENDREDTCQEVFIKIYQNLANCMFKSKLSTWIARISYNTCLNFLERKKLPIIEQKNDAGNSFLDTLPGVQASPQEWIEDQDAIQRIQQEIVSLPLHYRTILTLYHLEQMNYNEIGEITGMPEGKVKNYLFRARKILKENLEKKYAKEELWH